MGTAVGTPFRAPAAVAAVLHEPFSYLLCTLLTHRIVEQHATEQDNAGQNAPPSLRSPPANNDDKPCQGAASSRPAKQ